MTVVDERLGGDLLESLTIDPAAVSEFDAPKAILRFTDTAPRSMTPWRGLQDVGPYDFNTTDKYLVRRFGRCEIFCAYPAGRKDIQADLYKLSSYLIDGYTKPKGSNDADSPPFKTTFRLENVTASPEGEFLSYDLEKLEPFRLEVQEAVEEAKERGNQALVLVAIESHKSIASEKDVYVPLKRLLNQADIPSQFLSDLVTDEEQLGVLSHIRSKELVGWSLWNIALAIYTKLGGIPWAVTQSGAPDETIQITVGLRFAPLRDERGFCLGIATVLDRFGRLIGTVPLERLHTYRAYDTPVPGMSLGIEDAQRLVTEAFDKVLEDQRTQPIMQANKPLSVVIHKLGPGTFHKDELVGIEQARADKLKGHPVFIAYVPVVAGETLSAFGPSSVQRVMPEGRGLKLAGDTALLYTVASQRKFSTPITVKVQNLGDDDCAFTTVEHACEHIQTLCGLHWQMVSSGRMKLPADLHFAHKIAQAFANEIQPRPESSLWATQWYL
jgi:hypothetical protein